MTYTRKNNLNFLIMSTIEIFEVLQGSTAAFQDEGAKVYSLVESEIKNNRKVVLSFKGIEHCSTLFLNASVGRLYKTFSSDVIQSLLVIEGIENNAFIYSMIERVIFRAQNPQDYNAILTSALETA